VYQVSSAYFQKGRHQMSDRRSSHPDPAPESLPAHRVSVKETLFGLSLLPLLPFPPPPQPSALLQPWLFSLRSLYFPQSYRILCLRSQKTPDRTAKSYTSCNWFFSYAFPSPHCVKDFSFSYPPVSSTPDYRKHFLI